MRSGHSFWSVYCVFIQCFNTVDGSAGRTVSSFEFGTEFQREVPLFLEVPKFPHNAAWDRWKEASMPNTILISLVVLNNTGW